MSGAHLGITRTRRRRLRRAGHARQRKSPRCAPFTQAPGTGVRLIGAIGRPERRIRRSAGLDVALGRRQGLRGHIGQGLGDALRRIKEGCCGAHKPLPDRRRHRAAGHALHRRLVIIADPNSDDEILAETDEPCVAIVLACAGLASRGAIVQGRRAPGTLSDDAPKKLGQFTPIGKLLRLTLWGQKELSIRRLQVQTPQFPRAPASPGRREPTRTRRSNQEARPHWCPKPCLARR